MVHLVVANGTAEVVAAVEQQVRAQANGWRRLGPGIWLMGASHPATLMRDILHIQVPAAQIAVIRLQGEWGTQGVSELASWLKSAQSIF